MIDSFLGFFGQTFSPSDIGIVFFLVLLEGLLSADNALVLAIMVKHLPKDKQQKALLYGLAGAFVFRFVAILLATFIIKLWWLQALGAIYLVWVAGKHFFLHSSPSQKVQAGSGFWQTVIAVEITDIAFAVDSVVAAVAMVKGADKIWVVYLGAVMGVVLLRFAAGLFIKLLDRFPAFDHVAYTLVAWVGVKLMFMAGHHFAETYNVGRPAGQLLHVPEMDLKVFWGVMAVLVVGGTLWALRSGRTSQDEKAESLGVPEESSDFSPVQTPEQVRDANSE
jgi:YkoY family integral membrane protein